MVDRRSPEPDGCLREIHGGLKPGGPGVAEQVEGDPLLLEAQPRRGDRDAALALDRRPIRAYPPPLASPVYCASSSDGRWIRKRPGSMIHNAPSGDRVSSNLRSSRTRSRRPACVVRRPISIITMPALAAG